MKGETSKWKTKKDFLKKNLINISCLYCCFKWGNTALQIAERKAPQSKQHQLVSFFFFQESRLEVKKSLMSSIFSLTHTLLLDWEKITLLLRYGDDLPQKICIDDVAD